MRNRTDGGTRCIFAVKTAAERCSVCEIRNGTLCSSRRKQKKKPTKNGRAKRLIFFYILITPYNTHTRIIIIFSFAVPSGVLTSNVFCGGDAISVDYPPSRFDGDCNGCSCHLRRAAVAAAAASSDHYSDDVRRRPVPWPCQPQRAESSVSRAARIRCAPRRFFSRGAATCRYLARVTVQRHARDASLGCRVAPSTRVAESTFCAAERREKKHTHIHTSR